MKKVVALVITVCITTATLAQQLTLTGNINGFDNGTKFYLEEPETQMIIDSAVVKENTFHMKSRLEETPKASSSRLPRMATTTGAIYSWGTRTSG
jgi:hypothetical protein